MEGKEPIRDGRGSSRIKQNIRKRGLETTNEYIWKIGYLGHGFRLNSMRGMKLPVTATSSPICCRWNIVEGMLCFHDLLIYVVLNDTFSVSRIKQNKNVSNAMETSEGARANDYLRVSSQPS